MLVALKCTEYEPRYSIILNTKSNYFLDKRCDDKRAHCFHHFVDPSRNF